MGVGIVEHLEKSPKPNYRRRRGEAAVGIMHGGRSENSSKFKILFLFLSKTFLILYIQYEYIS